MIYGGILNLNHSNTDITTLFSRMNPLASYSTDTAAFVCGADAEATAEIYGVAGDCTVLFNGVLYNTAALAAQLGMAEETAPATVVAHGFAQCGKAIVSQLDGEFSLAAYDCTSGSLFLARDKIGSTPLFYHQAADVFLFSSSLKALLGTERIEKVIDKQALSQYLQLTYIPSPRSILRDVAKLPAATILEIRSNGETATECYWDIDLTAVDANADYARCKEQLRTTLTDSVKKRMQTGRRTGAFLSGGFDSTIIVGLMAKNSDRPIDTFTIGYNEKAFDESALAQTVADMHRTNHTTVLLDWDNGEEVVHKIFHSLEEPFADSSLISTYMVCQKTGEHTELALTGDAGDELFAGYNKYLVGYYSRLYRRIPRFITNGIIRPLARRLPSMSILARKVNKFLAVCDLDVYEQRKRLMSLGFKQEEMQKLMKDGYVDEMTFIKETYEKFPQAEEQTRAQYVDMKIVLEGCMLPKVRIAADMAHFNTCAPMLDTRVVELAFSMPAKFKISKKKRKIILKDAFSELIPQELYKAPKHGFSVPIGLWLKGPLKAYLSAVSDTAYLERQGLFNPDYIQSVIEDHMSGKRNCTAEIWCFLVFQAWYENFMTK